MLGFVNESHKDNTPLAQIRQEARELLTICCIPACLRTGKGRTERTCHADGKQIRQEGKPRGSGTVKNRNKKTGQKRPENRMEATGLRTRDLSRVRRTLIPAELCFHTDYYSTPGGNFNMHFLPQPGGCVSCCVVL